MLAVHAGFVLDLNIVVDELLRFKMSKSFHSKDYTIIMLLTPERQRDRQTDSGRMGEKESASEGFVLFLFLFLLFYWIFVVASSTSD